MLQQQQRKNKQSIKQESRGPRLRSCSWGAISCEHLGPHSESCVPRTPPPLKTPLQPAPTTPLHERWGHGGWEGGARPAPELRSRPGFSSSSTLAWLRVGEVVVVGGCRRSPGAEEASRQGQAAAHQPPSVRLLLLLRMAASCY